MFACVHSCVKNMFVCLCMFLDIHSHTHNHRRKHIIVEYGVKACLAEGSLADVSLAFATTTAEGLEDRQDWS